MDGTTFERRCRDLLPPARIARNVPLAPLTTFRLGGPADWLVEVADESELSGVLAAARDAAVPVTVLGGGSNLLVADAGVRGVVVRTALRDIAATAGRVRAGAGATINGLVRWTIARGLGGLETWAGTPGTVGGAIFGNAHFQGRNISDLVAAVRLLTPDGTAVVLGPEQMEFGYDRSRLQQSGEVVIWAEFAVIAGRSDSLRARARESLAYRKRTQPLALSSAGCIFQNPDPAIDRLPDGVPASAGALVDLAGLKGVAVGAARISTTHANFVVNEGGASAGDVRELIERARAAVLDRFGVQLRYEVVVIGQWSASGADVAPLKD